MTSSSSTVEQILKALTGAGEVTAKKMFGEYGIFLDGKMAALVCDDRFLVKPTPGGRTLFPDAEEEEPYPGAKPCLLVPESALYRKDWLCELLQVTAQELPTPKKKISKSH